MSVRVAAFSHMQHKSAGAIESILLAQTRLKVILKFKQATGAGCTPKANPSIGSHGIFNWVLTEKRL